MQMESSLGARGELSAVLIRKDGTRVNCGVLKSPPWYKSFRFWMLALAMAGLVVYGILSGDLEALLAGIVGIVTTAGVNYMAADFASGGVTPTISGFKFHDCGTGTVAAVVANTALGTPWGGARTSGTPTGSTNTYQTVATISNVSAGAQAITEWGLFSAAAAGTLWDRRVFAAINWNNGDSIQFTYILTVNAGGT